MIKKTRTSVIQYFIDKKQYKSYLEIGTAHGSNYKKINCQKKIGVEPKKFKSSSELGILQQTSDEYFAENWAGNREKFDIIFIDGLHIKEQVLKDIVNSLDILNENGIIVCHDILPKTKEAANPDRHIAMTESKKWDWNGNCYAAWLRLREKRPDLYMGVLNFDYGVGIIKRGTQQTITIPDPVTYEWFDQNRDKMNIITREMLENV
jgi:hypothetical protein